MEGGVQGISGKTAAEQAIKYCSTQNVVWLVSLLRHKALSQTSRAHYCNITKLITIESNCTNKRPHLTYDNVNEFIFINVHLQTVLIGYFDILQIWQGSLESTFLFQIIYIFCCL